MIGTRASPAASSALRIPATRPSIMSLGATRSTPARACDTATLPSRYTEASLSMSPSCTTPQCPWSVYSHRHTSPITSSWGTARFGGGGRGDLDGAVAGRDTAVQPSLPPSPVPAPRVGGDGCLAPAPERGQQAALCRHLARAWGMLERCERGPGRAIVGTHLQ